MPEENSGDNVQGEPSSQPPPQPPGGQTPPSSSADDNSNQPTSVANRLEDIRKGEYWLIGTGIATILLNGLIACIYYGQLRQMTLATKEATSATKASQQAAYASCVGAQISRAALLEAIQAGIDAHDSATASTYQTMVSTQAESANVTPHLETFILRIGAPIGAIFHIKNVGKSNAKGVVTQLRVMLVGRNDDPIAAYPVGRSARADTPILPADTEVSSLSGVPIYEKLEDGRDRILTQNEWEDFGVGKKDLLAFVRITYVDALGVSHWVNFCRTFPAVNSVPGKRTVHEHCISYNQADNNTILHQAKREATDIVPPEIKCIEPKP